MVEIKVDLKKMRIGDLATLAKAQRGALAPDDLLPILERVVGGVGHLPLEALPAVINAVTSALQELLDYTWQCEKDPSLIFDDGIARLPVTDAPRIMAMASTLRRFLREQRRAKKRRRKKRGK